MIYADIVLYPIESFQTFGEMVCEMCFFKKQILHNMPLSDR